MRIAKLFLSMFALAHFFACFFLYLADVNDPDSWIVRANFDLVNARSVHFFLLLCVLTKYFLVLPCQP
jgi:hypothetical protein